MTRTNPYDDRRMWHVFIQKTSEGVVCLMRHEVDDAVADDDTFILDRTFNSLVDALRRLEDKVLAHAAKEAAREAMRNLTPGCIGGSLRPQWDVEITVDDYENPLDDPDPNCAAATWMAHSMNVECVRAGRGFVVTLGDGHALSSNLMIEHLWTNEEKIAYQACGKAPIDLWQKDVAGRDCIALRLHNLDPMAQPLHQISGQRTHWLRGPADISHFMIVGTRAQPAGDGAISGAERSLDTPSPAEMKSGSHFWKSQTGDRKKVRDLSDPKWPSKEVRIRYEDMIQPAYQENRHLDQLTTPFSQGVASISAILHDKSEVVSDTHAAGFKKNQSFETAPYRLKVSQVNQATWDYGYFPWDRRSSLNMATSA
ncbi:uncharacterized protein RCC_02257 [Ramularia collo-cygni]|uniref:Uncharacterized protein n=1 Tax=Ramularia collo-cygni TaxID=112498 RepID=A0A2D3V1S6_9PEZI|nr:uncharacterized protein RCC_02257 [Ramularia collo-cygni]CZT16414.1 uncharacterized protein RCC_02257 [Ramularia collo-cygni]